MFLYYRAFTVIYIYSSSSIWDWADDLAKDWKKNNPELFEKIDGLKIQAQDIMDGAITQLFDMLWGETKIYPNKACHSMGNTFYCQ